jgi:alpha-galactosidase
VGANSWRTTGDIRDQWQSMDRIGFGQFNIGPLTGMPADEAAISVADFTRAGHFNDPDMLEVGNGHMTSDEYKTHFSLWCLLASPLLAGNDVSIMNQETKDILMNAEVIAVNQDPAGLAAKRLPPKGTSEVVMRPLKDKSIAVGLFNRDDKPADISVTWASLGIKAKKPHLRDLWKHAPLTAEADRFNASVPAHGVVMIRVSAK